MTAFSKLEKREKGARVPADVDAPAIKALLGVVAGGLIRGAEDTNAGVLKRLFERYPKFDSPSDQAGFWNDWLDDVKEWPAALIADACTRWRNSPAKRPPNTAGELRVHIARIWDGRRAFRDSLREALAMVERRAPETDFATSAAESGPWSQFVADMKRRFGEERAAWRLHGLALRDGVLWTGSHALQSMMQSEAGDILESFGWEVQYFPDRYNRLTRDRPPLVEREATPDEKRQMADGLRRVAAGIRAKHERRGASENDRNTQKREMANHYRNEKQDSRNDD